MIKYLIFATLLTLHPDKFTQDKDLPTDWDVVLITKICSVNGKQCHDKLNINKDLKANYGLCGQASKVIAIQSDLLHKIININKNKIKGWDKEYYIDSVCGYTIELNNSKHYSVFFYVDPDNYEPRDIKEYIMTLNDTFEKIK